MIKNGLLEDDELHPSVTSNKETKELNLEGSNVDNKIKEEVKNNYLIDDDKLSDQSIYEHKWQEFNNTEDRFLF